MSTPEAKMAYVNERAEHEAAKYDEGMTPALRGLLECANRGPDGTIIELEDTLRVLVRGAYSTGFLAGFLFGRHYEDKS